MVHYGISLPELCWIADIYDFKSKLCRYTIIYVQNITILSQQILTKSIRNCIECVLNSRAAKCIFVVVTCETNNLKCQCLVKLSFTTQMSDDGVAGKMLQFQTYHPYLLEFLNFDFDTFGKLLIREICFYASKTFGLADLNKLTPPEIVKLVVMYR